MGRLHSINRKAREFTIGHGDEAVRVKFRTLGYRENLDLLEYMEVERRIAREKFDTPEYRRTLTDAFAESTKAQIIDWLIQTEQPVVEGVTDLAPNATDKPETEEERAKREADAVVRWRENSKEAYQALELDDLKLRLTERRVRSFIAGQATMAFVERSLVHMVIDPETRRPLLSLEKESEDYIGDLEPDTRQTLIDKWNEFQKGLTEKDLRAAAESSDFLRSGDSEKPSDDSPLAIAAISIDSHGPSSPSTPSGSGSTT
jgi:hypothetical protein